MSSVNINDHTADDILGEILIDAETLQARIAELGAEITADYRGKSPLLICILRGAVLFLSDLVKHMPFPHTLDFMAVSSYGVGARVSSGQPRIMMDINTDIYNRHVIIIEDIIDTGHTLSHVIDVLNTRNPASVAICTLLDKAERRQVPLAIDYAGFVIPDKFVVGYGLDLDEYWRNLPYIGVVKPGLVLE